MEEGDILKVLVTEVGSALVSQGKESRSAIGINKEIAMKISTCLYEKIWTIRVFC